MKGRFLMDGITALILFAVLAALFLLVYARSLRKKRERDAEAARRNAEDAANRQTFIAAQRRLMSDSLRYDVMRRDGFRCRICGATQKDGVRLHVDHIVPVSRGGPDGNVQSSHALRTLQHGKRRENRIKKAAPADRGGAMLANATSLRIAGSL